MQRCNFHFAGRPGSDVAFPKGYNLRDPRLQIDPSCLRAGSALACLGATWVQVGERVRDWPWAHAAEPELCCPTHPSTFGAEEETPVCQL